MLKYGGDQLMACRACCVWTEGDYVADTVLLRSGAYIVACMGSGFIRLFDLTGRIPPHGGIAIGRFREQDPEAPKKIHLVEEEGPDGCCFVFIGKSSP